MLSKIGNTFQKQFIGQRGLNLMSCLMFSSDKNPLSRISASHPPFYDKNDSLQTRNVIAHNVGLKQFLARVYNTTALSICGALGFAYIGMSIPTFMANQEAVILLSSVISFVSSIVFRRLKPKLVTYYKPGVPAPLYKTENSFKRLMAYCLLVASMGMSSSPLFFYASSISPSIITSSLGITVAIFGGASAISYMLPTNKVLAYGHIFFGSLCGLLAINLLNLGLLYFFGLNSLSILLLNIDTYLGLPIFIGLIAYNTHLAIKSYEMGYADHLDISYGMLLVFWNILIRIMRIMSESKK